MTSLIDVIFLLLLFFMLTSTFTRFSEIQLSAAGAGASAPSSGTPPLFLQLGAESLSLNGTSLSLPALPTEIIAQHPDATTLLVSAADDVSSQRLVDLLVALAPLSALSLTVLD